MRKFTFQLFVLLALQACNLLDPVGSDSKTPENFGTISLSFLDDERFSTKSAAGAPLDTNSFTITITNPSGSTVYSGPYSSSPQSILASAGTYHIRVVSEEFTKPLWDTPQWGDDQYVKLEQGKTVNVRLLCRQLNSGARLHIDPNFLSAYPDGAFRLRTKSGSLNYAYREFRTAFFKPESMDLVLSRGATDEVLLSRMLNPGEILTLNIKVPSMEPAQNSITIAVDTTRSYTSETYTLGSGGGGSGGGSGKGDEPGNAYTVSQAQASIGEEEVWVGGFIVGGDLTTKTMSVTPPFSAASNLAIGPRSNTTDRGSCIAVQLPTGAIREALNLASNPSMQGRYVYLKGNIVEAYFGMVGLKNITDYKIK